MGYSTRPGILGHTIRTYWPDDTDTTMYIQSDTSITLGDLWEKAEEKWPGVSVFELKISSMEIQTDCLGYDAYDSNDHTDFIIITKE